MNGKATNISDYALIGNSRASALVSNKGCIDWCCLPKFDSPSIFAAILDREKGGHFSVSPAQQYNSVQSYIPNTNVLETIFETESGKVRLIDAFTIIDERANQQTLFPDHEILRAVEGISGTVDMTLEYIPMIYYGKHHPRLKDQKKMGIRFNWKEHLYTFQTTIQPDKLKVSDCGAKVILKFTVQEGERFLFSLSYSGQSPAIIPELQLTGWERLEKTIAYWKKWISNCHYHGLYEKEVRRSILALKLLIYAPSGAILAAPTASLPEEIGGERNWDYRYCWLRDASFTIRALIRLGFNEEAHAYMNWILHATQLTRPKLQVVYTVFGHASVKEKKLDWLKGYKNSAPVRIGNGADVQFQLDVYGEVLDAVYTYSQIINKFDRSTRKFILGLGKMICKLWNEPDNGIWEVRAGNVQHTHSKVMAWIGLNRIIKLSEKFEWRESSIDKFAHVAALIKEKIDNSGYNKDLKSYTRELNGNTVDASLLMLSLVGYCDPASDRMISTTDLIYERLSKNNLIYRYKDLEDGISGKEGCFGICNFWLSENLAKTGKLKKAIEIFDAVVNKAGPAGLLSEEMDPDNNELLGNYPQGFTHIGLINAAVTIDEEYRLKQKVQ